MNNLPVRKIVVAGVMSAIAIFLGATHLGFIPWIAGAALTIMHVPVIIGAILEGPIVGLVIGFLFGLFSLIQGAIAPTGPVDTFFVNPLVSILPRLLIGPVAWLVYRGMKPFNQVAALVLSAIAGSLTNTILVLTTLGLFAVGSIEGLTWIVLATIAVTNGLPEAGAAAIITLAVVAAWQRIEYGQRGAKLE
jgi:uncharacterized membrane protein